MHLFFFFGGGGGREIRGINSKEKTLLKDSCVVVLNCSPKKTSYICSSNDNFNNFDHIFQSYT